MPFNRPTPADLLQRIQAEIDIALPGADARLRYSVENVIAKILSMASHELHGHISWAARQILALTAEAEYLERHAGTYGITRKAATAAKGKITLTGINDTVIPLGTLLKRSDGAEYQTDAEVTVAAGSAIADVTALLAGSAGNTASASKLTLASPIAGMQSAATVNAPGLSSGTDIETDTSLRARLLNRIQQPPHGGAEHDYEAWAKEVAGVTRAWVYPEQLGLGTVQVIFVMDDKVGTIIPDAGEVEDVQSYIDSVRPATADVTVTAPSAEPVDFEINISPNNSLVQAAITAELQDFFKREAIPGGTLFLSRIKQAISTATGEFDHVLVTPSANVVSSFGDLSTLGTITFGGL
jgi:uncharacterized phage protein gp47/JayE